MLECYFLKYLFSMNYFYKAKIIFSLLNDKLLRKICNFAPPYHRGTTY